MKHFSQKCFSKYLTIPEIFEYSVYYTYIILYLY